LGPGSAPFTVRTTHQNPPHRGGNKKKGKKKQETLSTQPKDVEVGAKPKKRGQENQKRVRGGPLKKDMISRKGSRPSKQGNGCQLKVTCTKRGETKGGGRKRKKEKSRRENRGVQVGKNQNGRRRECLKGQEGGG